MHPCRTILSNMTGRWRRFHRLLMRIGLLYITKLGLYLHTAKRVVETERKHTLEEIKRGCLSWLAVDAC
jgi:hypothetical protein